MTQKFANIGSWQWAISTGRVVISDSVSSLLGWKRKNQDISFSEFLNTIHPEDKELVKKTLTKCSKNAVSFEIEYRLKHSNGRVKWFQGKGNPICDKQGKVVEVFGILWEVTDAKQIANELQQSKEKYQLLAELGQELICLHSLDGQYLYASPAMKTLLGHDPTTISKLMLLSKLVHPEDKLIFQELWKSAIVRKDEAVFGRLRLKHKNGKYIWCDQNLKVVLDAKGRASSIRSLTRNIENQIAFEDRLKETNIRLVNALEDLKEASEVKENFLSIMSHEIRTPLNSVIGLSNLLVRRNPREDQIEVIKTLKNSADNLMHLVNDVLDYSKITVGKVQLEMQPFSLTGFLQQQHSSIKLLAQDKGLDLNFQLDPRIPDQLEGDITRLNQIFTNLLTNAIKFTHEGHIKLEAILNSISEQACTVIFRVEDTGVGIAPDKFSSIFLPFQQSDHNITRKYGGTGLGLSIVKSLVELMNGKLELNSRPGKGSVFSVRIEFTLPSATPADKQSKALKTSTPRSSVVENLIHVLYVEDVESNRFLIENLLKDQRINCLAVSSGKAALRLTLQRKFNVILMDIQMPGMDGYQTTEKIRHQAKGKNKTTPIIAFTAEAYSPSLKAKTIQHGIKDLVSKPFNPDELIEKIRQYSAASKKIDISFSFSFYEQAFDNDRKKLRQIKKVVINDFSRFEKNLLTMSKVKNITRIRSEVHRIRPISKNLACNQLTSLLDNFHHCESYTSRVAMSIKETIRATRKLLAKLQLLKY